MVINPIVGVYIPIIRIPIKGGMTITKKTRLLTMAHMDMSCHIWFHRVFDHPRLHGYKKNWRVEHVFCHIAWVNFPWNIRVGVASLVPRWGGHVQQLGFAGESEAEAKLKMEDEVKIEEGPKRLSAWILGAIRVLECPRSCRKSMIFDKWVK